MRDLTLAKTDDLAPGIYSAQICRTRYIDDAVNENLAKGIEQLVILGAGLDSRAYRLKGVEKIRVFEADLPDVQEKKKKAIRRIFGNLPENVTYIPIDFSDRTLEAAFASSHYDPQSPTLFIMEGVSQYLAEDDFWRTAAFIGKSKPGNVFLFTYVLKSIIEGSNPTAEKLVRQIARQGTPWVFGFEPSEVQSFLKPFRLQVIEEAGSPYFQEHYLDPTRRSLELMDAERIVNAMVI
jgi:methyltransferase (TIGR00027 family)